MNEREQLLAKKLLDKALNATDEDFRDYIGQYRSLLEAVQLRLLINKGI